MIFPVAAVTRLVLGPSQPMSIGGPFHGSKVQPGHDTDCLPPSSAEVKKE
jgi:hypothetical protein